MRHPHPATLPLFLAGALAVACGSTEDSTSRDGATGGRATGGDTTTGARAGAPASDGGSRTQTGGSSGDGGSRVGGSGGASTGNVPSDGGVATGGAAAGGSGGSVTGGTSGGGTGGSTTGGTNAGGSGGGTGGTNTSGANAGGSGTTTGGASAGGNGGATTGGAPTGGTNAAGGDGGRVQCGVEICNANEICCGPAECGYCINELSGANCPDVCAGTGGAGGAGTGCTTNYAVPTLDRTCTTSADCFLGAHWADCCGSRLAVSFNNSELAAFTAVETPCSPACACPESAPRAEDGSPLATITSAVAECVDGQCLARGPELAGTCLTGDVCIDTNAEGECIAASGPLGAGICRGAAGRCFYCDCAAPDTPIATPTGDRPIAELGVGDLVYSVEDAAIVVVPIARINRRRVEAHYVVEVRLERGTVLQISAGHPTADGRTFGDLVAGDQLDGERIVSTEFVPYAHAYTHDILPASRTGTYFAGGVLIGSTLQRHLPDQQTLCRSGR